MLVTKLTHRLGQRLLREHGVEDERDPILNFQIRIFYHLTRFQAHQSRGQRNGQLATFGLADGAGPEAGAKGVQLKLSDHAF